MSEAPNTVSDKNSGLQFDMKPNFGFVRSAPGILMILNMILLFLAWVIMAGWKDNSFYSYFITSSTSFFFVTTAFPWLTLVILFLVFLLKLHTKLPVNWPLTLLINCGVWAILLIISSSIIANKASMLNESGLAAASAFGFFSALGLAIQSLFHFKEFRTPA